MDTLIDLTTREEFLAGLATGGAGVLVVVGLAVFYRERPVPVWGVTVAAASWISVWITIGRRLSLAVGLAALVVAGWLRRQSFAVSILIAIAGAALIAQEGGIPSNLWIRIGSVAAIVLLGIALLRWQHETSVGPLAVPLFAISAFGVWATVPETEAARVLLGVLVMMVLAAWPRAWSSIGDSGAFALAGLFVWIAAVGGEAREGSIIGAWASAGVLMAGLAPNLRSHLRPVAILLLQGAVVFLTSRVAGFQDSALMALAIAVPIVSAGLWALERP